MGAGQGFDLPRGETIGRDPPAAVRIATRQVSELVLSRATRWLAALATDRLGSLVFHVVASANLAHLPYRRPDGEWIGLDVPAELYRPVRIVAVAESMRLPNETVRRRVFALEDQGLLTLGDQGVVAARGVFAPARLEAVWRADEQALDVACRSMGANGHAVAAEVARLGPGSLPPPVMARLLLDFQVHVLETFTALYGDIIDGTIVTAVVAANVRHITDDADLSRQFAEHDAPPPDTMRVPVGVRTLSRDLDLPYETVRRRTVALTAQGRLRAVKRGLIVPTAALSTDTHLQNNMKLLSHLDRMLREIVRLAGG